MDEFIPGSDVAIVAEPRKELFEITAAIWEAQENYVGVQGGVVQWNSKFGDQLYQLTWDREGLAMRTFTWLLGVQTIPRDGRLFQKPFSYTTESF